MKTIFTALALLCFNSCSSQTQTTMTIQQLDSLCFSLSDEARTSIFSDIIDSIDYAIIKSKHEFISYIDKAYYNGRKLQTATLKQIKEGTLLRLAEGKLCIKEVDDFRGLKYPLPTEMVETEYFFLNNQLVKISVTIGRTDYNVMPQNYWVIVNLLDFVYHKTEPPQKAIYQISSIRPGSRNLYPANVIDNNEWREQLMNAANITEEQLKISAYRLYGLYISNKSLFNH